MNHLPYISVVVTTHNRPVLLKKCLHSILQQNVSNEIILCGDEGSIETRSIALNSLRVNDSLVIVPGINGPAATRNIGISLARGKWICFLDDDDFYENDYFEKILNFLKENEGVVNFFNYKQHIYDVSNNLLTINEIDLSGKNIEDIKVCNFIPNNAVMIPALIAKSYQVDEDLESHEDWEYLLKINNVHQIKHRHANGPVVNLRNKTRNSDSINSKRYLFDFITIYRKWPANNDDLLMKRKAFLDSQGLSLPMELI